MTPCCQTKYGFAVGRRPTICTFRSQCATPRLSTVQQSRRSRSTIPGSRARWLLRSVPVKKCWRHAALLAAASPGARSLQLVHVLEVFEKLDIACVVGVFGLDLDRSEQSIPRAQAQQQVFTELANWSFPFDLRPQTLVPQTEAVTEEAVAGSFCRVHTIVVDQPPGKPWGKEAGNEGAFQIRAVTRVRPATLFRSDRS